MSLLTLSGTIQPGYQVASGRAALSPYPTGSIALQLPYFQALGLDLSDCFLGTLNVSIAPQTFTLQHPDYTFRQVKWFADAPAEDFSFVRLQLTAKAQTVSGWLYYPHPETKPQHFQDASTLEILAPWLAGVGYGDAVTLRVAGAAISVVG